MTYNAGMFEREERNIITHILMLKGDQKLLKTDFVAQVLSIKESYFFDNSSIPNKTNRLEILQFSPLDVSSSKFPNKYTLSTSNTWNFWTPYKLMKCW